MNKIDCVSERMEEAREEGRKIGREIGRKEAEKIIKEAEEKRKSEMINIGIKLLVEENIHIDRVSKLVGIPVGRLVMEYGNYMLENDITSVNLNF